MNKYARALSRDDLSQWLTHLTKPVWQNGPVASEFEVLREIMRTYQVLPSMSEAITRYDSQGAACFYEVPLQNYEELINTNPNGRRGYGIIVSKVAFWEKGGRPAIYTNNPDNQEWPAAERFRLIATDLVRGPTPLDWTHEREWRIRGSLTLEAHAVDWCWPCVEKIIDAQLLFREFPGNFSIYVLELKRVLAKHEILV